MVVTLHGLSTALVGCNPFMMCGLYKFIILHLHLHIFSDEYNALVVLHCLRLNFLPRNDHYVLKVSLFELLSSVCVCIYLCRTLCWTKK